MSAGSTFRIVLSAAVTFSLGGAALQGATVSYNTGSLGSAADGSNADGVTFVDGVVSAGGDQAASYDGTGANTIIPFQAGLNPAAASPFTIEFWANPLNSDNDDAPVANRVASGDRSGWAFFQRDANTGWNFRMYDGVGSNLGWDLTGGTSPLGAWSHVVATWNGSVAELFVNGALADSSNAGGASGVYNASDSANFIVGSSDTGSPYTGAMDEVAFYGSVLTPAQILNHFNTISSNPDAYQATVRADGARLQLSNNSPTIPEPASLAIAGLGALVLLTKRASNAEGRK
jgi:hypothetical protein